MTGLERTIEPWAKPILAAVTTYGHVSKLVESGHLGVSRGQHGPLACLEELKNGQFKSGSPEAIPRSAIAIQYAIALRTVVAYHLIASIFGSRYSPNADFRHSPKRRAAPSRYSECAVVISVQNVSKVYHLYKHPFHRVLGALAITRRQKAEFWALRNINLRVEKGEVFALLGPNGSGKSTLLQIIAGILQPTSGRVHCSGRIAALLELGAGFNPEFSGRENVYLSGEIMGLSRRELDQAFPRIEACLLYTSRCV